jgi:hypothetical protein
MFHFHCPLGWLLPLPFPWPISQWIPSEWLCLKLVLNVGEGMRKLKLSPQKWVASFLFILPNQPLFLHCSNKGLWIGSVGMVALFNGILVTVPKMH